MSKRKLFFFFIDGIGLGPPGPTNPIQDFLAPFIGPVSFNTLKLSTLPYPLPVQKDKQNHITSHSPEYMIQNKNITIIPLDAGLGIPGLPQSATGQTSLFSGQNAPALLGYHLTAFPNDILAKILKEHSIMKTLSQKGIRVTSANLYSQEFFDKRANLRKNRFPASTLTIMASGSPFRYFHDYQNGKALFADITNEYLRRKNLPLPLITPEEGAERIINIADSTDFIFFEYFMTDYYGHRQAKAELEKIILIINRFLTRLWERSCESMDILIVSDHGNAEDLSTPQHTYNYVPAVFISNRINHYKPQFEGLQKITRIPKFIEKFFEIF